MKSRNQNREKTRKPLGPLLANLTQQYVDKRWPNPKRYFPFWSHLQKNAQNHFNIIGKVDGQQFGAFFEDGIKNKLSSEI